VKKVKRRRRRRRCRHRSSSYFYFIFYFNYRPRTSFAVYFISPPGHNANARGMAITVGKSIVHVCVCIYTYMCLYTCLYVCLY
jgi:uncharacterized membrane protein (DUF485 family)